MPLSKEKMREYMRERRKKELGLVEKESVVDDRDNLAKDVEKRVDEEATRECVEAGLDTIILKTDSLTNTDRKFEDDLPGYYIYGSEIKERECWMCGDAYKTRMELNKFCGPACKSAWLSSAFGKLKVSQ